jgi:hypothetical protein
MEYQTQNVREIQKRIRLLEKAERDLDALFRKERLVIAALESQRCIDPRKTSANSRRQYNTVRD